MSAIDFEKIALLSDNLEKRSSVINYLAENIKQANFSMGSPGEMWEAFKLYLQENPEFQADLINSIVGGVGGLGLGAAAGGLMGGTGGALAGGALGATSGAIAGPSIEKVMEEKGLGNLLDNAAGRDKVEEVIGGLLSRGGDALGQGMAGVKDIGSTALDGIMNLGSNARTAGEDAVDYAKKTLGGG